MLDILILIPGNWHRIIIVTSNHFYQAHRLIREKLENTKFKKWIRQLGATSYKLLVLIISLIDITATCLVMKRKCINYTDQLVSHPLQEK